MKPLLLRLTDIHGKDYLINIAYITLIEEDKEAEYYSKIWVVARAGYGTKSILTHLSASEIEKLIEELVENNRTEPV